MEENNKQKLSDDDLINVSGGNSECFIQSLKVLYKLALDKIEDIKEKKN